MNLVMKYCFLNTHTWRTEKVFGDRHYTYITGLKCKICPTRKIKLNCREVDIPGSLYVEALDWMKEEVIK